MNKRQWMANIWFYLRVNYIYAKLVPKMVINHISAALNID
ncbi:hypothetical protein FF38_09348 [Lucilia cuprina]|uniref:Uncharacterized protein n=1 Tax=Lucilia cuprina TaxID=7375 RepID=A0A0L0CQF3_LUCCU|nr:hypothetical protein FF38_09348 [Lucilia cuprina]